MKKYFLLLILTFTLCKFSTAQILCIYCYDQNAPISAGVNNLVLNGGFENGCGTFYSFCPNANFYDCDIPNWTCTGGGSNTYATVVNSIWISGMVVEGVEAVYFGNDFCNACSSALDTSCLNNIGCTVTGIPPGYPVNDTSYGGNTGVKIEQTINGLVTGNTYVLEFWAGGENYAGGPFINRGLFGIDVGFGDTLLRNKSTQPVTGIGTRYIIEFNAISPSHTIKFTNWGHICDSCTELIIDDVRLYTLAELTPSVPHCTVGINNPNFQNEENIFPNPVTNELNIKINTNDVSEIILYDYSLRKFLQQTFINSVSINTEKFSKGIYFYEIKNKDSVMKKGKVVKE